MTHFICIRKLSILTPFVERVRQISEALGCNSPFTVRGPWISALFLDCGNCGVVFLLLLSPFLLLGWLVHFCSLSYFMFFFSVHSQGLPFPICHQFGVYLFLWLQSSTLCLLPWHLSWAPGLCFYIHDGISTSDPTCLTLSSWLSCSAFDVFVPKLLSHVLRLQRALLSFLWFLDLC